MKNKLKITIFPAILLLLLMIGNFAVASEVTGTLSTEVKGTVNIPTGGGGGGGSSGGGGSIYRVGDANKDGRGDIFDFNLLMVHWGETTSNNIADFNRDSKVDILDFNLLMVNWTL